MPAPTFLSQPPRFLRYVVGLLVLHLVQQLMMVEMVLLRRRDCNCLGILLGIAVAVAAEVETDQVAAVGMVVAVGQDSIPLQAFVVVHLVVPCLVGRGGPSQEKVFVVVACLLESEIARAAVGQVVAVLAVAVQAVAEEAAVELNAAAAFANQEEVLAETEAVPAAVVAEEVVAEAAEDVVPATETTQEQDPGA